MRSSGLGMCPHLGWVTVAAVLAGGGGISRVRTFRLETWDGEDREALEPYHVAGGFDGLARVPPPADPEKVIGSGLRKQRRQTARNLKRLLRELEDWRCPIRRAALFVGRGRPASALAKVLASHAQIHVAEGNAVRDAVRRACAAIDIAVLELDRRRLFDEVLDRLSLDERSATDHLKRIRPDNDGGWRKEDRHAALAAWIASAYRTSARARGRRGAARGASGPLDGA